MKTIIRRRVVPDGQDQLPQDWHPVLRRVYRARRVEHADQVDVRLQRLHKPDGFSGMAEALALLEQALAEHWKIVVVADYDADGATACALTLRALAAMGAQSLDYVVPDRFTCGYGLSPELVEIAADMSPDLLITVDNGISSIQGVAAARARGWHVLVTDHHLPGEQLPDADAIVNPNVQGDAFPSKALAGVGVAFYLMAALRTHLQERGWFERRGLPAFNPAQLLDLVALGTVADVVPLDGNNRILVEQGMRRIRQGQCAPGISHLLTLGKRQPADLVASDLGFAVGPRLNAAGRLTDMTLGIECLLCDDSIQAHTMAVELDRLNRERRDIEGRMKEEALASLPDWGDSANLNWGLCLYDKRWHQGVVGILASRIKERYYRPVIVFARGDDGLLKGSARSIEGLHVRDVLESIATLHPGLIPKFGGHAMAAGLSLAEEDFKRFSEAFDAQVRQCLTADQLQGLLESDGELAESEMDLGLAEQLRRAGPWGQHFPEPLFDGEFIVVQQRIVGQQHLKLVVQPMHSRQTLDAILFFASEELLEATLDRVHLAYRLDVNEFRGKRNLQLQVRHLDPLRR